MVVLIGHTLYKLQIIKRKALFGSKDARLFLHLYLKSLYLFSEGRILNGINVFVLDTFL